MLFHQTALFLELNERLAHVDRLVSLPLVNTHETHVLVIIFFLSLD